MTPAALRKTAVFDTLPCDAGTQMSLWLTAAALHLADWAEGQVPGIAVRHPQLETYKAYATDIAPDLPAAAWPAILSDRDARAGTCFSRAAKALDLSAGQKLAFSLAALAEEDSRIGAFLAEIQGAPDPFPNVETITHVLCGKAPALGAGWDMAAPLLKAGLLTQVRSSGARTSRPLAPMPVAWDFLRGASEPDLPKGISLRLTGPKDDLRNLAYDQAFIDQTSSIARTLGAHDKTVLVLRHMDGADAEDVAAAIARASKSDLLVIDPAARNPDTDKTIGCIALLTGALPFLVCPPNPGETAGIPTFGAWPGPLTLAMGETGGLKPAPDVRTLGLALPFPGPKVRARAWRGVFQDRKVADFDAICARFQLPLGHVRNVARASLAQTAAPKPVTLADVRAAARSLGREQLDGLADLLPASTGWDDLIVPAPTRTLLEEFARFCIHREHLPKELGHAPGSGGGRGVRALFTGPSGTGKTLAARLLGEEVGTDVYRVDLSAVVDKYVGETEKRLHQLLSRAEALDVILLLDEGDGLMARRTDVNSSNDRFANLETNFLLQRLERHEGIAVVTTNMPEGIDQAFQRRMDVVVPFSRPTAEERLELWQRHLPASHAVPDRMLHDLAARASLTGGQIKNAVRAAASLALTGGHPLGSEHLLRGLERELQKAGAMSGVLPPAETAESPQQSLSRFASTISGGST